MNLNELFPKQKQLDDYIKATKNINEPQTLNKITSLSVELGELLNEFPQLFKFWSNKKNNHSAGLTEYTDCIHFALSIANDLNYTEHKYTPTNLADIRKTYLGLQNILAILSVDRDKRHLVTLFNNLIALGYQLGFSEEQVINAYGEKHEENYRRQKTGY